MPLLITSNQYFAILSALKSFSVDEVEDLMDQGQSVLARTTPWQPMYEPLEQQILTAGMANKLGADARIDGLQVPLMDLPPLELRRPVRPSGLMKSRSPSTSPSRGGLQGSPNLRVGLSSPRRRSASPLSIDVKTEEEIVKENTVMSPVLSVKPLESARKMTGANLYEINANVMPFTSLRRAILDNGDILVSLCDDDTHFVDDLPDQSLSTSNGSRRSIWISLALDGDCHVPVRMTEEVFDRMIKIASEAEGSSTIEGDSSRCVEISLRWIMDASAIDRVERMYRIFNLVCFRDFQVRLFEEPLEHVFILLTHPS